ncbi:MAG: UrcA family protein [Pseudomonadota bacterium]|nr:UrcA family protein [Pseudomonadota bacterium]
MKTPSLSRLGLPIRVRNAVSFALALSLVAPLAAVAQRPAANSGIDESPKVTVKYYDLDLNRPEAVAALFTRIQAAAKTTCSRFDSKELSLAEVFHACAAHAVEGAVTRVNQPALSKLYTAKTGKQLPTSVLLSAQR